MNTDRTGILCNLTRTIRSFSVVCLLILANSAAISQGHASLGKTDKSPINKTTPTLLQESPIDTWINGRLYSCTLKGKPNCVRNCIDRRSDGTCRTYTTDYCDINNPGCVAHCLDRRSDGTCRNYQKDFCARENPACVPNCSERRPDGTCRTYLEDYCSAGSPTCTPNCVDRRSNGTCRTYGQDICG